MSNPSPSETRTSLLHRLRDGHEAAWREFEDRYREMMLRFCIRRGLQPFDAEDIVQRVLASLAKSLPGFVYDRSRGRFRDYLYRCVRNAVSQWAKETARSPHQLRSTMLRGSWDGLLEGTNGDEDSLAWNDEWVANHYRRALDVVRQTFEGRSVEIFELSIRGSTIPELALTFGLSEEAVRKVRERIRGRLAELIAEQVREEDELEP